MDADSLKIQYFRQQIEKGIRDIVEAQRLIATSRIYHVGHDRIREKRIGSTVRSRSGALMEALENPRYLIQERADGVTAKLDWPIYIRFLDMKRHGNYKIYNRQVWGIIYKETFNNMRYEYREWLQKTVTQLLQSAIDGK